MMRAAPDERMRLFLCTQIADEARHVAFFDRFYSEVGVLESDNLDDRLKAAPDMMRTWETGVTIASSRIGRSVHFEVIARTIAIRPNDHATAEPRRPIPAPRCSSRSHMNASATPTPNRNQLKHNQ